MKKGFLWESFFLSQEACFLLRGLRFFALHHHFALVVKLSLVPVGAMEHVWLAGCGAGAHVGRLQRVVGAALARTRFALPSFWMCHSA